MQKIAFKFKLDDEKSNKIQYTPCCEINEYYTITQSSAKGNHKVKMIQI